MVHGSEFSRLYSYPPKQLVRREFSLPWRSSRTQQSRRRLECHGCTRLVFAELSVSHIHAMAGAGEACPRLNVIHESETGLKAG